MSRICACSGFHDETARVCSVKHQVLLLLVLQGPASQQVHEEEVKTLISEAVQAKEAEHVADLTRLQQGFQAQLQECEEDLKDRDRYCVVTCNTVWVDAHWDPEAPAAISPQKTSMSPSPAATICANIELLEVYHP